MATPSELITALRNLKNDQDTGPNPYPYKSAADLIVSCGAVARDIFLKSSVDNAAAKGISIEFGGYSKDKNGAFEYYAHTINNTIFMPHPSVRTLAIEDAMTWFLFETRNAMRAQQYCQLYRDAAKGVKLLDSFVYFAAEYETRGGLEVGEMWQKIISTYKKSPTSSLSTYYYNLYKKAPNWINDSKQLGTLMDDVLRSQYTAGKDKGKSRRQKYGELFTLYTTGAGKAYYSHPSVTCTGNNLKLISTTEISPIGLV
ncbi:MAG: hypothetical protein WA902_09795 [Thermosynechococcaceae cyanobacterium]